MNDAGRCAETERAASELEEQLERDVAMVADRCRQCVDEADRVESERRQFVDAVEKTADAVRQAVSICNITLSSACFSASIFR